MSIMKRRLAGVPIVFIGFLVLTVFSATYAFAAINSQRESVDWIDPETGVVDIGKVPERLTVVNSDGERVGYMLSSNIVGPDAPRGVSEVFDFETDELVGHMVPMAGFTPLGQDPVYWPATITRTSVGDGQVTTTIERWGPDGLIETTTTTTAKDAEAPAAE